MEPNEEIAHVGRLVRVLACDLKLVLYQGRVHATLRSVVARYIYRVDYCLITCNVVGIAP